ncbi:MCE family protein [Caulobacter sp. CCUG 60055]|uniref:MlaD family protein n=2 Tax=Pseudomonadota TaxID=1224 RepID=UPI001FA6E323|nr:MlaD family protein [Caulobacter sp. CCUG 60055]MBQ1540898.1 MCE family protein [Caulobacteraceae bacterium]MCI3179194.1 MCE family protein [Caulobacter sp. CCUG 60055]
MERNANYALVGLASLILFAGMVAFVVWLARVQFTRDYDIYDIVFVGPVRGLSEGGEVHFNGIKVGEVTKIALDHADPTRVITRVRMTSDVPVKTDSFATLEPQGITGVNYIQITAGKATTKLLNDVTPEGKIPVIQSQRSTLQDLLEGGGTVLTRTVEALDRVNRILSDGNIKTLNATLQDISAVTAEARRQKAIIADADQALKSIDQAATNIGKLSESSQQLVNGDGKRAMAQIADAAAELKTAAQETRGMIDKLQGPTSDFASTGIPQLQSAIVTLQGAAESLDRLVGEVEQNPRGLASKAPAKEIEVKP